jgi:hypothetical protein
MPYILEIELYKCYRIYKEKFLTQKENITQRHNNLSLSLLKRVLEDFSLMDHVDYC